MTLVELLIYGVLSVLSPRTGELAAGVHRTAPAQLTEAAALEHAHAALTAGLMFDVDPALLLAIAHHESRYDATARTREPGGKWSCGVMTPVPQASGACTVSTVIAGYLAGAAHLRTWLDAARGDVRLALVGYAGGYALIGRCRRGPVIVARGPRTKDVCRTPEVFLARARRIRIEATT